MIRALFYAILLLVIYQAVKIVIRSAVSAYGEGDEPRRRSDRLPGEEMVQDPQCHTYVLKERAVKRRIGGMTAYFCSSNCADEYERGRRS